MMISETLPVCATASFPCHNSVFTLNALICMMMLPKNSPASTMPILHGPAVVTQLLHWTSLLNTPRTKPALSCSHTETYF